MVEPAAEKPNLPVALSQSMAVEKLTDVATTTADIGLDALVDSGALDGVPIFGALTGIWRAGWAVRDHLFTKKVATFLVEFHKTPEAARKDFIADLERRGKLHEFGEQLLLLLDRAEDMKKPEIVARIMSAAATGAIPLNKAIRLAKIVDRAFSEDLALLIDLKPGVQPDQDAAAALFSAGLLHDGGIDGGIMSEEGTSGTLYHLNEFSELLVKHVLKPS